MIFTYEIKDALVKTWAQRLGVEGATPEEDAANVQRSLQERLDGENAQVIKNYIETTEEVLTAKASLNQAYEAKLAELKQPIK